MARELKRKRGYNSSGEGHLCRKGFFLQYASNYHLNGSSRIIDNSKVFLLSVLSPDDIPLVLHLAAPTESLRDDWWGGLLYCRSIVCYAAVKRKYKLKPHF